MNRFVKESKTFSFTQFNLAWFRIYLSDEKSQENIATCWEEIVEIWFSSINWVYIWVSNYL